MIKTFDTSFSAPSSVSSGSGSGSSTKTLLTIVVVLAVAYVGYKFVLKPMLDKNKEAEAEI
jgi:hypothetical protein